MRVQDDAAAQPELVRRPLRRTWRFPGGVTAEMHAKRAADGGRGRSRAGAGRVEVTHRPTGGGDPRTTGRTPSAPARRSA